jgi:hypothetical protein
MSPANELADPVVVEFLVNPGWSMNGQCVPVQELAKVVARQRK